MAVDNNYHEVIIICTLEKNCVNLSKQASSLKILQYNIISDKTGIGFA